MATTVQVWHERRCEAPQWPDWLIGIGTFDPVAVTAANRACPGYGGSSPLRQWFGRPNIGVVVRAYSHEKDPLPRVVQELQRAGFTVEVVERPAGA